MKNFSKMFLQMETYIQNLQNEICFGLTELDGKPFGEDQWKRVEGGGGKTRIIENGDIFEKGGVNTSSVHGALPKEIADSFHTEVQGFAACGISLVLHPSSPKLPTIHMNLRYFEMENGEHWFGGGIDLTPYFPFEEDFIHFHSTLKESCDTINKTYYSKFKTECDQYFYIKHRQEMRGVGGIFFDYLKGNTDENFNFIQSVGNRFLDSYLPIIEKRKNEDYNQEDKKFQLIRRGRYVEFNLIYDKGTLFGLKTNGRVESILMSLPATVNFDYNWSAKTEEHKKMNDYYQAKDWV
jgi:coproporphyrinogen III oxidase